MSGRDWIDVSENIIARLEDSRHMLARLCTFFSLTLCTVGKTTNADRVSIKTVQDCAVLYL
jgi:hypothetical protein